MWTLQLAIVLVLFSRTIVTSQPIQRPIRINAGSDKQYRDSNGNVWSADDYYHKGKTFSELFWVFSTDDRDIYRNIRYDEKEKENQLTYDIPVANGYYIVRMHFAELFSGAQSTGARVFDVEVEGRVAFPSLDVFAEAGGYTALIKETKAQVQDGTLSISFARKAENPFISGIEALPYRSPSVAPETKPPIRQDSGKEEPPPKNQRPAVPKPAHEPLGGVAVWGRSGQATMRYSEFDGEKFVSLSTGPDIQFRWGHVRGASAPSRDEMIVVGVTDEGTSGGSTITAAMWTENSWDRISIDGVGDTLGTAKYPYWNNAQVAYESQSGDALLVWNDKGRLLYSEWNGESWTKAASISGIAGEPQWFDIAKNPLSNEIVVVLSDSSNRVYVLVWNGSRWSNGPSQISVGSHQAGIAVAYESQSNRAMVVYGRSSTSSTCQYRIWDGARWSSEYSLESPLGRSTVQWVALRSDPNSNQFVLGVHTGDEDAWLSVWRDGLWDKSSTIKATTTSSGTQTNTQSVLYVAFESNSSDAIAVYRDRHILRYRTLRKGSWSPSYDIPNYRETPTSITLDSEPGSNRIMMLAQDDDGDIHSVQWDGDSQSWNSVVRLETATGEWKNQPFSFMWKNPFTLPERATVTVEPTLSPSAIPTAIPTVSPLSSSPSNEPSRSPFGVDGFVLVDAATNQDVEGAFDCDPINECVDLSGKFNIQATVFGEDIATVTLEMNGPVARNRINDEPPYTIYRYRRGNYRGRAFQVGRYTISAFATDSQGESSGSFSMAFNVSYAPSASPSEAPSRLPSDEPSPRPTILETPSPTTTPTISPTLPPTTSPSGSPSLKPTTLVPSSQPTTSETASPTTPPTVALSESPTSVPTNYPTSQPSYSPSEMIMSDEPSSTPSSIPSGAPTRQNTPAPTSQPSLIPTEFPSPMPSNVPSLEPSVIPTSVPTSEQPSQDPTSTPSVYPTAMLTTQPTTFPSREPSRTPTNAPTTEAPVLKAPPPSISAAAQLPSESPSWQSASPSFSPTFLPSSSPSAMPSNETTKESNSPSQFSSSSPTIGSSPTDIEDTPIAFTSGLILKDMYGPTCVAIGNGNGKIYVGTQTGLILQIEVDEKYQLVSNRTSYAIPAASSQFRSILGIAVDPMDTSPNPAVYVSHSTLFHGKRESFNGAVSKVSGPNLDVVEDLVTGLPVSDLDHGVNGLVFGDRGELYINVGSNTNSGVPGPLSSSGKQKDALFSGATLVAYLNRPNFQGNIELDKNGDINNPEIDVELFAVGLRNPYGIVLHSNGYLYATDNGPNAGFGRKSVTCDEDAIDPSEGDELNLLEKGKYYGHANRKRGQNDPRQCTWRSQTETSDEDYTAPIAMLLSSSDGVIEFQADHFEGKLRGHLIVGQYKGGLYDIELSSDGRTAINKNATLLTETGGVSLAQGPDGTLFVARNDDGEVIFVTPKETKSEDFRVVSVFPRRGPQAGGSLLRIYGHNFNEFGTPLVTVGGEVCPLRGEITDSRINCELPRGTGTVDIVVTAGSQTATFARGYRYISGE